MNILRGTFRISLVVAVLAGIWGGVSEWKRRADDFGRQYDQAWQAQETLKCGKRSVEFHQMRPSNTPPMYMGT
jgi:hypothetical protein